MYTATFDFDADIDEFYKQELNWHGFEIPLDITSDRLRMSFFNYKNREISSRPRNVIYSSKLECPDNLKIGLKLVEDKFKTGTYLLPHLSKNLANLDYNDPLLNDWGIHHLHLGEKLEPNSKWIVRTGPLLYVKLHKDEVIFINVLPHGAWTNVDMIRILHYEFPYSIENFRLRTAVSLSEEISEEQRYALRKSGYSTAIEIQEGVVYHGTGGGILSNGASIIAWIRCNKLSSFIVQVGKYIEENLQDIGKSIKDVCNLDLENLRFKLVVRENGFVVVEEESKFELNFGRG